MEQIRVVELFAGVGGFRLGLEQASSCFQTVWANQWEPSMRSQFAFECYALCIKHILYYKNYGCSLNYLLLCASPNFLL